MLTRPHVEFPRSGRAELAGVGEAPSQKELLARRPFVGPAGRVLHSACETAGIVREEILLTNVFETPLPGTITSPMVAAARERLSSEFRAVGVRGVVAFGQTAAEALMAQAPRSMKKTRGVPAEPHGLLREVGVEWVLPTFHPASCLGHGGGGRKGSPQNRFFLAADLVRAQRLLVNGPDVELAGEIEVLDGPQHLRRWLLGLWADEVVAVDIETRRGQIDTIGLGVAQHALVVPVLDPAGGWKPVWPAAEWAIIRATLKNFLEGPHPKVFQNGAYDVWWLAETWGIIVGGWKHDTRLLHHALEPELPKDLATLASLYAPGIGRAWKERHSDKE